MPRVYALRAPKVRNECAHICAMGPKELIDNTHTHTHQETGDSAGPGQGLEEVVVSRRKVSVL